MTKRKRIIFAALIACGIVIFMVCLSRGDFSPVPRVKITHIDRSTVAQTLCQKEIELANMTIVGGAGQNTPFKKAIDDALTHNNSNVVAEYVLELGFGAKRYCKDTVTIKDLAPDQTILSVKCQIRDDLSDWSSNGFTLLLSSLLSPLSGYKRDYGREYVIMADTVQQLQSGHNAQVEWLGKWRPENSKSEWPDSPPGAPCYPAEG